MGRKKKQIIGKIDNIPVYKANTVQTIPNDKVTIEPNMFTHRNINNLSKKELLNVGCGVTFYYKGTLNVYRTYKADEFKKLIEESSLLNLCRLKCLYEIVKDDDVNIVFGNFVPFVTSGVIQRKNFYKQSGLQTYGQWATINKQYLGKVTIKNLEDNNGQERTDKTED